MVEYAKLMSTIPLTDDEAEFPELVSKRSESTVCSLIIAIGIAATVFLTVSLVIFLNQKPAPPPSEAELVIRSLLEAPEVKGTFDNKPGETVESQKFNFTQDSAYSEKVRINIRNMILNETMLMYQPSIEPIRPFVNMYSKYQIDTRYNLSVCMTPKAMATTFHGIFCYLHDTESFDKKKLNLETVYWNEPICTPPILPRPQSTSTLTDYLPVEHNSFQVVREPIRRFVSAFINKCINEHRTDKNHPNWKYCYDCNEDIECVVTKAHQDIMKRSRLDRTFTGPDDDLYFSTHFYPLTWQCDLHIRYESIHFIRYISGGRKKADMVNQLLSVMQMSGVENYKLRKISSVLLDDKPLTHATKGTNLPQKILKKIYNSQKMLDILTSLYYYDYLVFEYPLPKFGVISELD